MQQYNGLWGFGPCALCAALLLAGCATAPETETYPLTVPASEPRSAAAAPVTDTMPAPAMAMADEEAVRLREDAPMHYVVKKGDTLWDIAGRFLTDPWQWPEIWYVNAQIQNPHLIYPGDRLTLIWRDGRPVLIREEGPGVVDRLSPQVRVLSLDQAIPTIPLDAIRDFLKSPRVVTREQLRNAPYILDFVEPHVVGGAPDQVFIKKLPLGGLTQYEAVRLGERYVDPASRRTLGWEALPVGKIEVQQWGDPAIGTIVSSSGREARRGDHLLKPEPDSFQTDFIPHAPANPVDGRIIRIFDGVSWVGQYQVVTINRGAQDGIESGHVLSILQATREARDPYSAKIIKLPEIYAGTMMIFKVDARLSYGLVMSAVREIRALDKVEKPRPSDR